MKVLFVAHRYYPYIGGTETYVRELALRMNGSDVSVTILTTDPTGLLPRTDYVDGIEVRRVQSWPKNRDYYFAPGLAQAIREEKWDVLHCPTIHTLVPPIAMYTARQLNLPYFVTFHTGGNSQKVRSRFRGLQWQSLRPLLSHAAKLIGPSEWEVSYFQKQLHLPTDRFAIIPNGSKYFSMDAPHSNDTSPSTKQILSIGRLERYKGHQYVIDAMPLILKQEPDARLKIIGIGPYESMLHKRVDRLQLNQFVEITKVPPGDDLGMATAIAQSEVVISLSEHEAQGLAVLDAIALGRPVIVTFTTALVEYVKRGEAIGVPFSRQPEQVAEAVLRQLRDPKFPLDMLPLTWDVCAAKTLELYRSIVEQSK